MFATKEDYSLSVYLFKEHNCIEREDFRIHFELEILAVVSFETSQIVGLDIFTLAESSRFIKNGK